jgi:hypothetical protein
MKNGGWTLAKPNTISMPLPNLAAVGAPMSIGGVTCWSAASSRLPVTLGDGTFLVCNMAYAGFGDVATGLAQYGLWYAVNLGGTRPNGEGGSDGGALYEYSIRQGVGVTYPSGSFILQQRTSDQSVNWSSYIGASTLDVNQNPRYWHTGWAVKLSGVTSGGLAGGGFGGGIQPN